MKIQLIAAAALFCALPLQIFAQNLSLNESILSSQDRTYVSFFQGIGTRITPDGRRRPLEPLLFEAQIAPSFFVRFGEGKRLGLSISPKVVLRMFNEESFPVRTPSYMPNLIFYHAVRFPLLRRFFLTKWFFTKNHTAYLTYRLNHHSNGQNGRFLDPATGKTNFENGSFSTNFVELAFNWAAQHPDFRKMKRHLNGRIGYERHLRRTVEPEMRPHYFANRFFVENRWFLNQAQHDRVMLAATYSLMTGDRDFAPRHSFDGQIMFKFLPDASDFSFFGRFYAGPDYYNLRFENRIFALTFGLVTNPVGLPLIR